MGSSTNHVIANCIMQAAAYIDASRELEDCSIVRTGIVSLPDGFCPSDAWKNAAYTLFQSLHANYSELLDSNSYDDAEADAWRDALEKDPFEPFGWVHRIILTMQWIRRHNGGEMLGDAEFQLVMAVVRERVPQ